MTKFNYKVNERGNASVELVSFYGNGEKQTVVPSVEEHIVVPSMIDGYVVDEILENGLNICESSLSIYVPKTVTRIGNNAFQYCINAIIYFESAEFGYNESMHGGDAPTAYFGINENNLFRDEKYDYILMNDGTALIAHYNSGESKIVVPTEIKVNGKSYKITELGEAAFENPNIWDAEEVFIPSSVKVVSDNVFNRLENAVITRI